MPAYHPYPPALDKAIDNKPADTVAQQPRAANVYTKELKPRYGEPKSTIDKRVTAGVAADVARQGVSHTELKGPQSQAQLDATLGNKNWTEPLKPLEPLIEKKEKLEGDLKQQFKNAQVTAKKIDDKMTQIRVVGQQLQELTPQKSKKRDDKQDAMLGQVNAAKGKMIVGVQRALASEDGARDRLKSMEQSSLGIKPGMKPSVATAQAPQLGAGGAAGAAAAVNPVAAVGMMAAASAAPENEGKAKKKLTPSLRPPVKKGER